MAKLTKVHFKGLLHPNYTQKIPNVFFFTTTIRILLIVHVLRHLPPPQYNERELNLIGWFVYLVLNT